MEVYERINFLLQERKLTKKEFAKRLLLLEPKLKSTGEVPTERAIYSYLNGNREIKLELIPYIAEALDITEQEIFDDTITARLKYLKHILKNPTSKELEFIKGVLEIDKNINIKNSIIADVNSGDIGNYNFQEEQIIKLLKYAPIPFLQNLTIKLKKLKEFYQYGIM